MTVFKTYLRVLRANIGVILLYSVILIAFGGFNMKTSDGSTNFVASKPDILIINYDELAGITKNLVEYLEKNTNQVQVRDTEDARNDALFYRDVNYIIYIPEGFREDFLNHQNPEIEVKSTGDYQATYAEMILEQYLKVANVYLDANLSEEELISNVRDTLSNKVEVMVTSKLDTNNLSQMAFYYNFASYSLLAGCVYVICLILSSFRKEVIHKRTVISSISYRKYNRVLFLSNSLFALSMWGVYVLLSFLLLGSSMITLHGLIFIINSFLFTVVSLAIAFLIGNLVSNKNAINGIVNVVALGSSFLCGAFVPMEWLPRGVLTVAHILPSYYYIKSNELLKELEVFQLDTLGPIFKNMLMLLLFVIFFAILANYISNRKRRIN